jgi:hypothetical protein
MPAEIRDVEAQRQTCLQQVVCAIDFERFAVYVDSGHGSKFFVGPVSAGVANGISVPSDSNSLAASSDARKAALCAADRLSCYAPTMVGLVT